MHCATTVTNPHTDCVTDKQVNDVWPSYAVVNSLYEGIEIHDVLEVMRIDTLFIADIRLANDKITTTIVREFAN